MKTEVRKFTYSLQSSALFLLCLLSRKSYDARKIYAGHKIFHKYSAGYTRNSRRNVSRSSCEVSCIKVNS